MELTGDHVRLEPLRAKHADELWPAADDDAIRAYWPIRWDSIDGPRTQIRMLGEWRDRGDAEPYLIRTKDGAAAGTTTLYGIDPHHKHAVIGWTFILPLFRRTAVNTETKLLLLGRAFDDLGLERVQFDVDTRNIHSQEAVLRLGATREGVLRKHKVLWDGYVRDTAVFSIVKDEWPAITERLLSLLDQ